MQDHLLARQKEATQISPCQNHTVRMWQFYKRHAIAAAPHPSLCPIAGEACAGLARRRPGMQPVERVDSRTQIAYAEAYANGGDFVPAERHVKLFKNGRNQAVRIPREFELPAEDAIMRKEGERLIIEPSPRKSLLRVLATLAPLEEDFPPIADAPPGPVEL
jgi:antitoxin VapB